MDWNDFVQRLSRELMHLPANAFVIVQGPDGFPYVQAMRYLNGLDAEAVSNAYLPRPLDAGQERQMSALGWLVPDGQARHNWWCRVLVPVKMEEITSEQAAQCGELAGRMVAAFRDVYGLSSPDELVYLANRNGEDAGPLQLPGLGIPRVDPELAEPDEPAEPAEPDESTVPSETAEPLQSAESSEPPPPPAPPSPTVEDELAAAKGRGDQRSYLQLVMETDLYLPVPPEEQADAGVRYATAIFNDGTYVLAFTSPEAMERSVGGEPMRHRRTSFADLARAWPRPDWQLAINTGLPSAAFIDSGTVRRIAQQEQRPATPTGTQNVSPTATQNVTPATTQKPTPTVMQKVVRPEHVTHYVEGGYDRVAGHVHRLQDVREMTTPEQLVHGLSLTYDGSPFWPDDPEIHVIRWPLVKDALLKDSPPRSAKQAKGVRAFTIDSQRLPHGAELYRLDRTGRETLVAVFNADIRGWVR